MSKRYYWLKLNENFFEREEIKIIEDMPNGKDYIIFYLKLLLKAIKTEGQLIFREVIPYTPNMLASITGTDIDTVRVATELFLKLGLMEKWDDGTLFMVEVQNMVGSETASARRVRKYREKKKIQKLETKALLCDGDETKCNTEIEIDKELEIDKEKEELPPTPYEKIKTLYNTFCLSLPQVRAMSEKRKRHLRARWRQFACDLTAFEEVFRKVEASEFCKGKNDRGWRADFDWLIKNDHNMVKVLEGKYDNREVETGGADRKRPWEGWEDDPFYIDLTAGDGNTSGSATGGSFN